MKYLKKFNESSEYYTSQKFAVVDNDLASGVITYDNGGELHKAEEFTESEKLEIDDLMLSRLRAKRYEKQWSTKTLDYNYLQNFRYTLSKTQYEWYFLGCNDLINREWSYYKCDQYEGIIKLIDDLGINLEKNMEKNIKKRQPSDSLERLIRLTR